MLRETKRNLKKDIFMYMKIQSMKGSMCTYWDDLNKNIWIENDKNKLQNSKRYVVLSIQVRTFEI